MRSGIRFAALTLAVSGAFASATALAQEPPSAMSCQALWQERNGLLKSYRFCFQDDKAVKAFGNDGCTTYSEAQLPLTPAERSRLALIDLARSSKRCP